MSATRDSSQPITFVFTSLHEVYRKGLEAARNSDGGGAPRESTGADLEHPRFGAPAPEGHEKLFALRSETYRVIKPAQAGVAPVRKATLRSSGRVLKAGQISSGVRPHHPVSLLNKRLRKEAPTQAPLQVKVQLEDHGLSIHQIERADSSRLALGRGAERLRETLSRLDRLQSRLHFLLREIKDYSGEGNGQE